MKILVLGGTQFVGRHIVESLFRSGHSVTIFNRGKTNDEISHQVERLRGDRDQGSSGLDELSAREWDVCVDVSGYLINRVRSSTEKLRMSVKHYVFISAVSVYGNPANGPVFESHPLSRPAGEDVTEITNETYGPLKVACENIVQEIFAGRCTILRPQVVAGPYDPIDRLSYWVRRSSQDGEMLVPGDGSDYVQFIDADDVAQFTRTVCEKKIDGIFNLAGTRLTWAELVAILRVETPVWVPKEIIINAGLTEDELPLYRPARGPRSSLMHVSNAHAIEAGLTLTDPVITVINVRNWLRGGNQSPALSPEREADLIKMFRST